MKYGHFDNENFEYVIDRVDIPVSWTNYIGTKDLCGVFNHTAGGYVFYKSPEYHRITRFRPNGVPMDRPGHYVYIRDDETGEYWSVSWQPVGKPLDKASYSCRHGLSYIKYLCDYDGVHAEQKLFTATDDPVEFIDVLVRNDSGRRRTLSLFGYIEFSFHHIDMDNRNFQMSLYCAGSAYEEGVIEHDLFYEPDGYQFFTSSMLPDSFDCVRDIFIGPYRTETNPLAVERGICSKSFEKGGNHCGALHHKAVLLPGESMRIVYILGEGGIGEGKAMRKRFANSAAADREAEKLKEFWQTRLSKLYINTPDPGMNTLINIWTLYQSSINVRFSRFSSFIEVGGRTGLGFRDTAQDAMCIPHAEPDICRLRLRQLLQALTKRGYGLHLFDPRWFEEEQPEGNMKNPTLVIKPKKEDMVHGADQACADDALWLIAAVAQYIKETGDTAFLWENIGYADGGEGSVYEHMLRILEFSREQTGANGICRGLRADWNDCLNLGGGESAMVSFLYYWSLRQFAELARFAGKLEDAEKYGQIAARVREISEEVLWDGEWYIRGITADGRRIGTHCDEEGRVHLESNAWAVLSGAASRERGILCMDAVRKHLFTRYGLMLNAPPYTRVDDGIGFVTRVYPGVKENGSIFSHPNPWAWAAECVLGRGDEAKRYYDALSPYNQNDLIEIRQAEPYSYCQFIMGASHTAFGRARHPFMTGSAGWAYFSATQFMLGIRPGFDRLIVEPCIPASWNGFEAKRIWRKALYDIRVHNPGHVGGNVIKILLNGKEVPYIPVMPEDSVNSVEVWLGEKENGL